MTPLATPWRSGTGKVLAVGDEVRLKGHPSWRFRVTAIAEGRDGIEITVWGGRPSHEQYRVFSPERLSRRRVR